MAGKRRNSENLVDDVVEVCRILAPDHVEWCRDEVTRDMVTAILQGRDEADLADPDARRDLTAATWTARDVVERRPVRDPTRAFAAKVAFVVADLRADRTDQTQPWESAAVAEVLGLGPPIGHPVGHASDPCWERAVSVTRIQFVFPWRPSPVRTGGRLGTAPAHACLTVVDAAEAPVACSLWTPEGRIEVRRLGKTWLRPVLSPGSWRPVDASAFAMAAASGRAWRDNPFLPRTGQCCPTFDLGDLAAPRALAKGDEFRIAAARDACLAGAGPLFLVDGFVHRTTKGPLAGIGTVFVDGIEATGPMWVMGGLCSASSMGPLGHEEQPAAFWFNRTAVPEPHGPADRSGFARGEGVLPSSTWVALTEIMEMSAPRRWSTGGPWPQDASELVREVDVTVTTDAAACLRTAAWHAGRLSLVAPTWRQDVSDRGTTLRAKSEESAAALVDGGLDIPGLVELREAAEDVLALIAPVPGPLADMWTYVAAIVVHVASHELGLLEVDEGVMSVRL